MTRVCRLRSQPQRRGTRHKTPVLTMQLATATPIPIAILAPIDFPFALATPTDAVRGFAPDERGDHSGGGPVAPPPPFSPSDSPKTGR